MSYGDIRGDDLDPVFEAGGVDARPVAAQGERLRDQYVSLYVPWHTTTVPPCGAARTAAVIVLKVAEAQDVSAFPAEACAETYSARDPELAFAHAGATTDNAAVMTATGRMRPHRVLVVT
jgi:hypothetical protein